MSNIIPFKFEGSAIRVVDIDGEPWFVGRDVAERLGYARPNNAMNQHCKGALKQCPLQTAGGMQEIRILSEPDVLRLIMASKLPAAERFERWVFEEVLPSIRKHGGYMVAAPEETPEQLAYRALTVLHAAYERQKAELAAAAPKVAVHDRIVDANGSLCVTDAAKALQVKRDDLNKWLMQNRWAYRRPGDTRLVGYHQHTVNGDLEHKIFIVLRPDGSEKATQQMRIAPQGIAKLAKLVPGAKFGPLDAFRQ